MNSYLKPNSGSSTGSRPTLLGNGCKDSACEMTSGNRQPKPSGMDSCPNDQADSPELSFTSGTLNEQQTYSMACAIHGPFQIRTNNSIGLEVLDADGSTIAGRPIRGSPR